MKTGKGFYQLPAVPHGYGDLAPSISEQLLRVHHDGHHRKYVNQVNSLLEKTGKARAEGSMPSIKSEAQALAFNVGGHFLHSLSWNNNVLEHTNYLDYKNEKAKYTSNFWNTINWDEVDRQLEKVLGGWK